LRTGGGCWKKKKGEGRKMCNKMDRKNCVKGHGVLTIQEVGKGRCTAKSGGKRPNGALKCVHESLQLGVVKHQDPTERDTRTTK